MLVEVKHWWHRLNSSQTRHLMRAPRIGCRSQCSHTTPGCGATPPPAAAAADADADATPRSPNEPSGDGDAEATGVKESTPFRSPLVN